MSIGALYLQVAAHKAAGLVQHFPQPRVAVQTQIPAVGIVVGVGRIALRQRLGKFRGSLITSEVDSSCVAQCNPSARLAH